MSDKDWKYAEGCGCVVTFFAKAEWRTSHMASGPECKDHTGRYQVAERDCLMERASAARDKWAAGGWSNDYHDMPCESCGQLIPKKLI